MNVEYTTNEISEQTHSHGEPHGVCDPVAHQASPEGLLNRTVHVFVFNSRGELLISQRSAGKDRYPLCFTSSASTDVSVGDDVELVAARELRETLGLVAPLEFLGSIDALPEDGNGRTCLYASCTDDSPSPDEREIESIEYVDIERLSRRCRSAPQRYTPAFRRLFDWYRANAHGSPISQMDGCKEPSG